MQYNNFPYLFVAALFIANYFQFINFLYVYSAIEL